MAPKLNQTAVVILGMLAKGARTGYDIKVLVDKSTRFFWSASYSQIYPELRGLEAAGLVRGEPDPHGGRTRTAYELTEAGAEALRAWLTSTGELTHEIREEGVLKLFFVDVIDPRHRLAVLRAMRERYERLAARLRERLGPLGAAEASVTSPLLTARFGIEFYDWLASWCRRTEDELRAQSDEQSQPP